MKSGLCGYRHRRCAGDVGASAVEFALMFPIFAVLAMGTITAGTAFSKQINITQAARETSRFGATLDITSTGGIGPWLAAVDDAATASAGSPSNPLAGYTDRCVAYVRTSTTAAGVTTIDNVNSKHKEAGGAVTAGPCPRTSAPLIPKAQYVQVVITRNTQFFVIFANPNLQLGAKSVTPYERDTP